MQQVCLMQLNFELARGIINAAESTRSPVIMGTAEVLLPYGPLEAEFKNFSSMDKGFIDIIPAAVEAGKQESL